jgi:DNA topoisomerase-1
MVHATLDLLAIDFHCGSDKNVFRATGSTITHAGFMAVYLESLDDGKEADDKEHFLPPLKIGEVIPLEAIVSDQHFTDPPPRYSEASLVKSLEEHGIGRPSTYATIISTLQNREYVTLETKRFYPTDVGRIVNKFLTQHFTQYVDYNFTANLEDNLDAVARGEKDWIPLMKAFWEPFTALVKDKDETVQRKDVTQEIMEEKCPECDKPLSTRLGRNGCFIGCTDYPTCSYTRNLNDDGSGKQAPETIEGRVCPQCQSDLIIKVGRYGKFIGCSSYPKCKHIEPLEKPEDTEIECPECKKGHILKRKARSGKIFYSCEHYPKCKYALWNPPIDESCPDCQWPILTLKTTKRRGEEKVCPQKMCKYSMAYEQSDE